MLRLLDCGAQSRECKSLLAIVRLGLHSFYGWGFCEQDVFEFTTRNYSDYGPTLVGNGYLFGATAWNGATAAEAVVAGLYDHLAAGLVSIPGIVPS